MSAITPTPTAGLVAGTKVGFGPHAQAGSFKNEQPLPQAVMDSIPPGPLRYRAGDPLAMIKIDGSAHGRPPATVEAYTQWQNENDLINAGDSLRGALKVAFKRSKNEQAQAVLQAKDGGSYWVARLSTMDQKPLQIDGRNVKKTTVTADRETGDLVAIIGKDAVINFSDQKVKKPHWWDPIFG